MNSDASVSGNHWHAGQPSEKDSQMLQFSADQGQDNG